MSAEAIPPRSRAGVATHATLPAQLRYLEVLRTTVQVAMDGWGIDAEGETDIGLAVDELASVLILQLRSVEDLHLTADRDRDAVHIELSTAASASGPFPQLDTLSRQLLEATTDMYVIERRGSVLVGRLRRRLVGRPSGSAAAG